MADRSIAISDRAWGSISEADYATPNEFCSASLIDLNPKGAPKTKDRCKLPVREPKSMGGAVNRNGVHAAAQRLGSVDAPAATIRKAAGMLIHLYSRLGEEAPDSVRQTVRS